MAQIMITDVFDELIEENKEITECLNVLIKFKNFVDLISSKLKSNLGSNDLQMFDDLHKEVEEVFKRNKKDFSVNKNLIQKKAQNEILSSKSQTNNSKSLQLSSKSCEPKVDVFESQLKSKALKVGKQIKKKLIEGKDFTLDENQMFVCSFIGCRKRFKGKDNIRQHLLCHSTDPKRYVCDYEGCGYTTWRTGHLKDHKNTHKGIKPFSCDICEKHFTSEKYRKSHIDLIHNVSNQVLICELEECYKQFKSELSLKIHQKFHLKEKRFVCTEPNCSFKAPQASGLKYHISRKHSDYRPFVCQMEDCSKSFRSNGGLRCHMKSHNSERNFKCEFEGCGKAFTTIDTLRRHNNIHTGVRFKCDWPGCEYITHNTKNLGYHQSVHSTERNFLCSWPECDKRFKNKAHLRIHLRIHKNDKRYACSWPGCQYRCTDSGNLYKHRKIHLKK